MTNEVEFGLYSALRQIHAVTGAAEEQSAAASYTENLTTTTLCGRASACDLQRLHLILNIAVQLVAAALIHDSDG